MWAIAEPVAVETAPRLVPAQPPTAPRGSGAPLWDVMDVRELADGVGWVVSRDVVSMQGAERAVAQLGTDGRTLLAARADPPTQWLAVAVGDEWVVTLAVDNATGGGFYAGYTVTPRAS